MAVITKPQIPAAEQVSASPVPTPDKIRERLAPLFRETAAQRAIVFGSHARGDAHARSDLDIVIIAESDRSFVSRFKDYLWVWDVWGGSVDMIVYTPAEFKELEDEDRYFIKMLLAEGVIIYEN